jgi:hypothetical protein
MSIIKRLMTLSRIVCNMNIAYATYNVYLNEYLFYTWMTTERDKTE